MSAAALPTLAEFLAAPHAEVARVAPATMIYSNGGSRRAAALAGVAPKDYPGWSLPRMYACVDMFFQHGIQHLFVPMLLPNQYNEKTPGYRENIERWVDSGLAGPDAITHWQRQGWRVRLLGSEHAPDLQAAEARLVAETASQSPHTVWFYVVPEAGLPWEWVLAAAHKSGARTRDEAARALYGEDIPPATLLLSSDKPAINHDLLPPLLIGDLQCYWDLKPGYSIDQSAFRQVLYDYAYLRRTWQEDKSERARSALAHRAAWENGPILGLGKRLGPFWYPQAVPEE